MSNTFKRLGLIGSVKMAEKIMPKMISREFQQDLEKKVEQALENVTTHRFFLEGMSALLNANSYRKILVTKGLRNFWKSLELPNKYDQEKTLYLVSELQFKLQKLEAQIAASGKIDSETDSAKNIDAPKSKRSSKSALSAIQ